LPFPPSSDNIRAYARLDATAATKHRVHKLLRSAFQIAVDDEKIARNPCKFRGSPAKPKGDTVVGFAPAHSDQLLGFVHGRTEWEAVVMFAFDAGRREHEIFGLQVQDVDLVAGEVFIRVPATRSRASQP
jgi:integrase